MSTPAITTVTTTTFARRFVQEARRYRALIALWLTYEASQIAFFFLSRRHGLLQGVSVVSFGVLAFGAWLLLLRFAVLFYLPLAVVSRVARRWWLVEPAPSSTSAHPQSGRRSAQ